MEGRTARTLPDWQALTVALTPNVFRRLIWVYVGMFALTLLAGLGYLGDSFSPLLQAAYDSEPNFLAELPYWGLVSVLVVLAVFAVVVLASLVGLYRFRRWGRALALWSTVGLLPLLAVTGPTLSGGLESMFRDIATMLWGGLLALSWYGPVGAAFAHQDATR